jgi:PAS domain S-box-containing protein
MPDNISHNKENDSRDINGNTQFLQSVINNSLDVIQVFKAVRNGQGKIIDFVWIVNNSKGVEQNGEVIGKSILQQNPGVVASGIFNRMVQAAETGVPSEQEQYYSFEQFKDQWYYQAIVKHEDGVLMTTRDITPQKKAEQEVLQLKDELAKRATNKYLSLFNSIDEGFCIIEVLFDKQDKPYDYRFIEVNSAFEKHTGLTKSIGRTVKEMVPSHEQHWFDIYGRIAKTGEPARFENAAEGIDRYYNVYGFRIGEPGENHVAVLFSDITDSRKAAEALRKSEDSFRSYVSASSDIVYKMSGDWKQMQFLHGKNFLSNTDVSNETWLTSYIPPHEVPRITKAVEEAIREKKIYALEHQVIDTKGNIAWVFSRAVPMLDEKGNITEWMGAATDITQSKQAEETLQQSEEKYRTLFNTIESGYTICEAIRDESGTMINYRFIEVNPALEKLTGLKPGLTIGKTAREVLPGLDPKWFAIYQNVIDTKQTIRMESYVEPLQNWYDITAFYYGKEQFAAYFDNITERKEEEQKRTYLLTLSDALSHLEDSKKIMATACRVLGEHLGVTRVMYVDNFTKDGVEYFQLSGEYNVDIPFPDHPIPVSNFRTAITPFYQGKISVVNDVVKEIPVAEQEAYLQLHIYSFIAVPLLRNGKPVLIFSVHFNQPRSWREDEVMMVSETAERTWAAAERASAEEKLRVLEERNRIVLQSAEMGSWDWNVEADIAEWNEQHNILLGLRNDNAVQKNAAYFFQFVHPDDRQKIEDMLSEAVEHTGVFKAEFKIIRADNNEVRWMGASGRAIDRKGNRATRMVGVIFDITERKKLEQQKEDFLGIASHELKTPVTTIMGYGQLLEQVFEGNKDETSFTFIQRMNGQVQRLNNLISDLLDTTKVVEGQLVLHYEEFDITELVQQVVDTMQTMSAHHIRIKGPRGLRIDADKKRIEQVIVNLLSNAIKYSPGKGEVVITTEKNGPDIKVSVADEGIGISEESQEKIFSRFFRVQQDKLSTFPGMGLGLYIASGIVHRHKGTISVQSKPGEGSVFSFTLPGKR